MTDTVVHLRTRYYQQFDADPCLQVPAESFGGWKTAQLPLDLKRSALVVMHAWDYGSAESFPGWRRVVEYIPRAERICKEVLPDLLRSVRSSPMQVFHVVSEGDYYRDYPGFKQAKSLVPGTPKKTKSIDPGEVYSQLKAFRSKAVYVGEGNQVDVQAGFARLDFAAEARPLDDEGIAEDADQLLALCREHQVDHLIYVGFALNWCLLQSPGGMVDMRRHGLLCSTIPEAVTAVENKESARREGEKMSALWRVALEYGFVYALADFSEALKP
ncbi:MAG: hypothetical protein JJU20_02415 [Opitutales bacterium]|nr:hypothetical protein [Opitutales bacterium]